MHFVSSINPFYDGHINSFNTNKSINCNVFGNPMACLQLTYNIFLLNGLHIWSKLFRKNASQYIRISSIQNTTNTCDRQFWNDI